MYQAIIVILIAMTASQKLNVMYAITNVVKTRAVLKLVPIAGLSLPIMLGTNAIENIKLPMPKTKSCHIIDTIIPTL